MGIYQYIPCLWEGKLFLPFSGLRGHWIPLATAFEPLRGVTAARGLRAGSGDRASPRNARAYQEVHRISALSTHITKKGREEPLFLM